MTLEAIKAAIAALPDNERLSLATWLIEQDSQHWNKELAADFAEGGPGEVLIQSWDAEIRSGNSVSLEQFLSSERKAPNAK